MGRNRSHAKSFNFIAIVCFFLLSCSDYSSIPGLFDEREYQEIQKILSESERHWEWYLWQNKLKIEGNIGNYTSQDSLYSIIQADSTFKLRDFKRFFYLCKFHSSDFIRDLITLEDRFEQPVKSNYYYGEILNMLRSRNMASHTFAIDHFLEHLDMSYLPFLIPEFLNVIDDSSQTSSYRTKIRNLASLLELHSHDKILRVKTDSLYEQIEFDPIKNELSLKTPILTDKRQLSEFKMIHFYVLSDSILSELVDTIITKRNYQYYFVLSRREIAISDIKIIRRIFSAETIDDGMMFEIVKQIKPVKIDSIEQLMFDYDSYAIKSFILNQIDPAESSPHFIDVYFSAFHIGKLQREIEKRLRYFSKSDLNAFVNSQKSKVKNEHLAFLIYWIGICGLDQQTEYVKSFENHSNLVIKKEAEQTLKRLKQN